jgi:hypothetical protein
MNKVVSLSLGALFALNAGMAVAREPKDTRQESFVPSTTCQTVVKPDATVCNYIEKWHPGTTATFFHTVEGDAENACARYFVETQKARGQCTAFDPQPK